MQVFYEQFGAIMMEQPVIGTSFTNFAPLLIIPYTALLVFNVFNRCAQFSYLRLQSTHHPPTPSQHTDACTSTHTYPHVLTAYKFQP